MGFVETAVGNLVVKPDGPFSEPGVFLGIVGEIVLEGAVVVGLAGGYLDMVSECAAQRKRLENAGKPSQSSS